jgi:hypothetical protein
LFSGEGCTDIGCGVGLQLTVHPPNNIWPTGGYAFEFRFASEQHNCTIAIPDSLPADSRSTAELNCEPQLDASFSPETKCSDPRTGETVRQACVPVPGHWILEVSKEGTPATVAVRVERDGVLLLEAEESPKFEESRPNGPGCGPVCKQTTVELRTN